jgi:Domain of unknown function (DUF4251)
MKNLKSIIKKAFLFLFFATSLTVANAQNEKQKEKQQQVQQLVESKEYVFVAQSMSPTRGGMRQLNSSYDLHVSSDSVIAYLPYFGRAYSAPIDPEDGPIKFTSTKFTYQSVDRKKGGWDVYIKPGDSRHGEELMLTIFENGSASLRVTSNNRQPVTFNGYINKAG